MSWLGMALMEWFGINLRETIEALVGAFAAQFIPLRSGFVACIEAILAALEGFIA